MGTPVIIVDYDPQWPELYEQEKERLQAVTDSCFLSVEHVGSTAVPGLAAKPIIDIMAGVRKLEDVTGYMGRLAGIGYEYLPEFEATMPERRFFRKGPPEARTHHLHVVELHDAFWLRHILFRDFLRTHPEVAREYARLKRELAARYGSDRDGYTEAKTPFIRGIEAQASAEAANAVEPPDQLRDSGLRSRYPSVVDAPENSTRS